MVAGVVVVVVGGGGGGAHGVDVVVVLVVVVWWLVVVGVVVRGWLVVLTVVYGGWRVQVHGRPLLPGAPLEAISARFSALPLFFMKYARDAVHVTCCILAPCRAAY